MRAVGGAIGFVVKLVLFVIVLIALATALVWRNLTSDDPTCPHC